MSFDTLWVSLKLCIKAVNQEMLSFTHKALHTITIMQSRFCVFVSPIDVFFFICFFKVKPQLRYQLQWLLVPLQLLACCSNRGQRIQVSVGAQQVPGWRQVAPPAPVRTPRSWAEARGPREERQRMTTVIRGHTLLNWRTETRRKRRPDA